MRIKEVVLVFLVIFAFTLSSQVKLFAAVLDDWQKLIQDGSAQKFDGQYKNAIQTFTKAVNLTESQKLPAKCLPIALCRLADAEVTTNQIVQADICFQKIIALIKQQKEAGTLDPKVSFWAAALSDSYLANTKPETRETCIKRACYLKTLIYGDTHRECLDCLNKLAECYVDAGKVDKAIHILTIVQTVAEKQFGKHPDVLADRFCQLAGKCRTEHKYEQAKQLELAAIKLADNRSSNLYVYTPTFYSFVGMNCLSLGKNAEGKEYFQKAIQQALKFKSTKDRSNVCLHLGSLNGYIIMDTNEKELGVAESETRQILAVYQAVSPTPLWQYGTNNLLSAILDKENRPLEAIKGTERSIEICKSEKTSCKGDIPDLYMGIAKIQASARLRQMDAANKSFTKALDAEKDKKGPHATLVLFWWGYYLQENNRLPEAIEKLHFALVQAHGLPVEKRGTLLADTFQMLGLIENGFGRKREAQLFYQQSTRELSAQRKVNQKLWPNIFNR